MLSPVLSAISFLAPWMAWGAVAAVGLPLLAHLFSKTRYREVIFPAARLVQQAVAATSRIESPRHRLLMLLRWLVLLLLVLAFMRPQWSPQAQARQADRGIALVLLLDASASMQRTAEGVTLYDRALREAERLINRLDPAKDVAAVVRVDHAPRALLPEPTARLGLLVEELTATQPGYTHASWPAAVAEAQRLLRDERRAIRVVTLSDQQGELPAFDDSLADRISAPFDHVRIDGPTDNAAVRLVDVRPYPAIAGRPMTATVEVKYFGDQSLRASLVATFAGDRVSRAVDLAPGGTRRVALRMPARASQDGYLRIALEHPDAIAEDNSAGVWLPVQSQTRVLIVHDADRDSGLIARRLATLLNPGEVPGITLPSVERVTINAANDAVSDADPADLRTVVLLSQAPMPESLSQSLEVYAQAGGGVVRFAMDAQADPSQTTTAAGIDFELEPLRLFEGPSRAGLSALPWPGVGNAPIDERAAPILTDAMERVIVAEMQRGRGRLIAINAVLRSDPGGLLAQPAFVVLFNELCRYASPGPSLPDPARPGDAMPRWLLDAARVQSPEQARSGADVFTMPGLFAAIKPSGAVQDAVFVSLDPSESETQRTPAWSSQADTNDELAASVASNGRAAAVSLRDDPVELWPYVVLGMIGLMSCESLLLWRFAGPARPRLRGAS